MRQIVTALVVNLLVHLTTALNAIAASQISADAQSQLSPYLKTGDRVVLLENNQPSERISKPNTPTPASPRGQCFGFTQAQLVLLSKIKFAPGVRNDDKIAKQIFTAAQNHTNQTVEGFASLKEFITEMEKTWDDARNPLKRAIAEIQEAQSFVFKHDGSIHFSALKNGDAILDPISVYQLTQDPEIQARFIKSQIDSGLPVWAGSFEISSAQNGEVEAEGGGHAFIIVGYIENDREAPRLIVRDPNFPDKLRVIESKSDSNGKSNWTPPDSTTSRPIALALQTLPEDQKQELKTHFTITSTTRPFFNPRQCEPQSLSLREIFSSATKP